MPKKKLKKGLIKKGTPLPTDRRFKFDSAHLKAGQADKREDLLLDQKFDTRRVVLPRQHLVYKKKWPPSLRLTPKPIRITPKSRRIT